MHSSAANCQGKPLLRDEAVGEHLRDAEDRGHRQVEIDWRQAGS